uniref:Transmembrane ascorbate-dependent reductase CYB561 n=1 Tax=Anas platyrhynchos platyrhynchos TaxID=8840 RepID=A0A493T7P9_ANAPP
MERTGIGRWGWKDGVVELGMEAWDGGERDGDGVEGTVQLEGCGRRKGAERLGHKHRDSVGQEQPCRARGAGTGAGPGAQGGDRRAGTGAEGWEGSRRGQEGTGGDWIQQLRAGRAAVAGSHPRAQVTQRHQEASGAPLQVRAGWGGHHGTGVGTAATGPVASLPSLSLSPQAGMDGAPPPASPAGLSAYVAVSQLLGLTLLAATGAWLGRYRGGVAWQGQLQFNVHPLCMVLGMVFLQGDALLV